MTSNPDTSTARVERGTGCKSDGEEAMKKTEYSIRIAEIETVAKSWARDLSSYALFAALIGTGVYVDSSAMQWAGFIAGYITILAQAGKIAPKMTITQARDFLDGLDKEIKHDQ